MELKADLIRSTLLYCETLPLGGDRSIHNALDSKLFTGFTPEEIVYSIITLEKAGLIEAKYTLTKSGYIFSLIGSPTFEGHKYLDNIRDPEVWKQTKKATSKFASVSIDVLSSVAASVITKMLGMG